MARPLAMLGSTTSRYSIRRSHPHVCMYVPVFRQVISDFFPECVARVPVSLWGSDGGLHCVRQTLPNRPQPFATFRNRPREDHMAVPMVSSPKGVTFWRFPASHSFISRGRCGTFVTFQHVSWRVKSRFVWQAQYFCHVFKRCFAFFVAGATLWTPLMSFCVAGAAL